MNYLLVHSFEQAASSSPLDVPPLRRVSIDGGKRRKGCEKKSGRKEGRGVRRKETTFLIFDVGNSGDTVVCSVLYAGRTEPDMEETKEGEGGREGI